MSANLVPLRAEALVRLEEAGALSGVGLDLSMRPSMTYEQYASIGALLGRATTALRFAAGDWLVFGEEVFGEKAADASELLGMSPEGRMELARVARAIPRSRRRAGLSWGHHRLLAARWIEPLRGKSCSTKQSARVGVSGNSRKWSVSGAPSSQASTWRM